jgi:precorrin-3B methylase
MLLARKNHSFFIFSLPEKLFPGFFIKHIVQFARRGTVVVLFYEERERERENKQYNLSVKT